MCVVGVGCFSIKKSMVDGCDYSEVGRDFINLFSSEMFSHIRRAHQKNVYTL
jgi:hypothetical protein